MTTPALHVVGRWLANLRGHVHVTSRDWADAQGLVAEFAARGVMVGAENVDVLRPRGEHR